MTEALNTWRDKLDYLLQQEAIASDPAQKFQLKHQIAEARAKVAELTGSLAATADSVPQIAPSRLHHGADCLFGREQELANLEQVWKDSTKHVLTIVAFGGVGKTSLVIEWMARHAAKNWEGFERVFDWSFFSQGTREQGGASSDTFIAAALKFFGDEAMGQSAASAWDKGARLAHLVAQRRTLLVLDGLEPLQHPPGPLAGELKDPALSTLLKGLAQRNTGLCIVTTRESVRDLKPYHNSTAPEWQLDTLSDQAGSALLKSLLESTGRRQVKSNDAERLEIVQAVKGHALALQLLGSFIQRALGDVRKWREVKFTIADAKVQGGYAFKTMGAYEKWLGEGGEEGARQLAVLRLLGLFDRPADAGCLVALRRELAIEGLTESLVGLDDVDWNLTVSSLSDCGLVSLHGDQWQIGNAESAIDTHPLIREYFAKQLREKDSAAWREGHRRLYEHLSATTEDKAEPTLEDLQPLYQAIAHGCQAGLYFESFNGIYIARIWRHEQAYSINKLGTVSADFGVVRWFFEEPWNQINAAIPEYQHAGLFNIAAYCLRALGRLTEAREPSDRAMLIWIRENEWTSAALESVNQSAGELVLAELAIAERYGKQAVDFADRGDDSFWRFGARTTLSDAILSAGRTKEAEEWCREAEQIYVDENPGCRLVCSWPGFSRCEAALADAERLVWKIQMANESALSDTFSEAVADALSLCRTLEYAFPRSSTAAMWEGSKLLNIGLDHLTLGRLAMYRTVLEHTDVGLGFDSARERLGQAVQNLRAAGHQDYLPRALLTRSWLGVLTRDTDAARDDLNEAMGIAERGPMKLFMVDIYLYRARLFGRKDADVNYPWSKNPDGSPRSAKDDLAAARKLIEQCGYWRRKEELEDAEAIAENW